MPDADSRSPLTIRLEYKPCNCPTFDHVNPAEHRDRIPENAKDLKAPENFEREKAAALRLRQLVLEFHPHPKVHHQGLHVVAAEINGERFEEGLTDGGTR